MSVRNFRRMGNKVNFVRWPNPMLYWHLALAADTLAAYPEIVFISRYKVSKRWFQAGAVPIQIKILSSYILCCKCA